MFFTRLLGMAKPSPSLPPDCDRIKVLMPISSPSASTIQRRLPPALVQRDEGALRGLGALGRSRQERARRRRDLGVEILAHGEEASLQAAAQPFVGGDAQLRNGPVLQDSQHRAQGEQGIHEEPRAQRSAHSAAVPSHVSIMRQTSCKE